MYDFISLGCAQTLTRPYSLTFKTNHWQVLTNVLWIRDLDHSSQTIFTVVEGNSGFWWPEMPRNKGFEPLILDYFHHGWRIFWILMVWNAAEWRIWTTHLRLFSPWLKEILDFDDLKCPRMKDLNHSSLTVFTMVEGNFGFWWSKMPQMKDLDHS